MARTWKRSWRLDEHTESRRGHLPHTDKCGLYMYNFFFPFKISWCGLYSGALNSLEFMVGVIVTGSCYHGRFWVGGGNRGQCPHNSESGPPCGPLTGSLHQLYNDRFLAMFLFWRERQKLKCLSSLLPNQNCWNCKHRFVWMRDLSFLPDCMCPLTKKPASTWPPY